MPIEDTKKIDQLNGGLLLSSYSWALSLDTSFQCGSAWLSTHTLEPESMTWWTNNSQVDLITQSQMKHSWFLTIMNNKSHSFTVNGLHTNMQIQVKQKKLGILTKQLQLTRWQLDNLLLHQQQDQMSSNQWKDSMLMDYKQSLSMEELHALTQPCMLLTWQETCTVTKISESFLLERLTRNSRCSNHQLSQQIQNT